MRLLKESRPFGQIRILLASALANCSRFYIHLEIWITEALFILFLRTATKTQFFRFTLHRIFLIDLEFDYGKSCNLEIVAGSKFNFIFKSY